MSHFIVYVMFERLFHAELLVNSWKLFAPGSDSEKPAECQHRKIQTKTFNWPAPVNEK